MPTPRKQPREDVPKLQGKRRRVRRRPVPPVPGDGAGRGSEPIDFTRISGGGGQAHEIPDPCRAKADTGSADDMWIRTKMTERSIPEEAMGEERSPLPAPDNFMDYYGYPG